jgi:MraZ protein
MFRGQFVHSIDAKGRVSVPARFRDTIVGDGDSRLVLTPSPADPCLHLHRFSDWLEFEKRIAELPRFDSHIVRFRRLYVSAALECELDKAGRLLIAPDFREKARLSREILWAGMGGFVELWSKELWDAAMAPLRPEEHERFMKSVEELIRI